MAEENRSPPENEKPPSPSPTEQDPSLQPGGDPGLEFGPRAPTMPQYFLGYALLFGGVIAFALLLALLMKLLR